MHRKILKKLVNMLKSDPKQLKMLEMCPKKGLKFGPEKMSATQQINFDQNK